MNKKLMKGKSK